MHLENIGIPVQDSNPNDFGSRFVTRVTTQEYNLAQQRGDSRTAGDAIGKLIGFLLGNRNG